MFKMLLLVGQLTSGSREIIACVTEQHYVSIFFTHLWSVRKLMLFQYKGSLVTNQQKCHFSAVSLHFRLPFGFVLYACAVENPKISGFCVSKSRGLRTDHKRVKNIKTQCCSVTQTSFLTAIIQRTFDKVFKVYFNSEHDLSFDHFLSILKTMTIFFVNKKKTF